MTSRWSIPTTLPVTLATPPGDFTPVRGLIVLLAPAPRVQIYCLTRGFNGGDVMKKARITQIPLAQGLSVLGGTKWPPRAEEGNIDKHDTAYI